MGLRIDPIRGNANGWLKNAVPIQKKDRLGNRSLKSTTDLGHGLGVGLRETAEVQGELPKARSFRKWPRGAGGLSIQSRRENRALMQRLRKCRFILAD